jgi:TonB-dependent SusC/RagA subfamily outer membrane receptor
MYKNLCLSLFITCIAGFALAQKNNTITANNEDSLVNNQFPFYSATGSLTSLLDGTVPGLQVTNGGGQPGANGEIRIRGPHSIRGDDSPLIVLDGMPYLGAINSININDIASIHVIKDAEATMIYGIRGANGVIEIITKKAKDHVWRLQVDAKFGINNRAYPDYDLMNNAKDYYETYWEAYRNALVDVGYHNDDAGILASGLYPTEMPGVVTLLGGYNAYDIADSLLIDPVTGKINPLAQWKYQDNWTKELQRTGMRHDYSLSAGKAGEKGNLFFSAGYLNDGGYIKHTGFERFNARLNGNIKIVPWLKAGLNVFIATATTQFFEGDDVANPFYVARNIAPIYPAYYLNENNETETDPLIGADKFDWGNKIYAPESSMGTRPIFPNSNVLGTLSLDKNQARNLDAVAIPYIEARFLKHFTFRSDFYYNYGKMDSSRRYNLYYGHNTATKGATYTANTVNKNYTWNQVLSWKRQFGDHHFYALLGHESFHLDEAFKYKQEYYSTGGSATPTTSGTAESTIDASSYFGRLNYAFLDKYTFFGGIRKDGYSAHGSPSVWSNNWSAGAAWFINNEQFLRNKELLNLLKLRFSYGISNRSVNTLGGEKESNLDIGLDFAFLKNRLSGQLDFFSRKDMGSIALAPIPGGISLPLPINMTTSGLELGVYAVLIHHATFSWDMGLKLSHYKNRITKMPDANPVISFGNYQLHEGGSIYDFYLVASAGVDHRTGNELYYYTDKNGRQADTIDYAYALSGRVISGSALPDLFGGWSNSFSYKNIELAFHLNFALGGKYYDQIYQDLMGGGMALGQNWSADMLNRWTPENPNSDIPRVDAANPYIGLTSTRFLTSASYLQIGRVMLSYHFSQSWVKQIKLNDLKIYLAADNLALFAAHKGMDPQVSFQGNPGYVYSPARTIMFGIHVGL